MRDKNAKAKNDSPQRNIHELPDDAVLTPAEAAAFLNVSEAWIRAHANKKRRPNVPGWKAGKYWRFRKGTLKEAMARWETQEHKGAA